MTKFKPYLESLPLTRAVKQRVSEVLDLHSAVYAIDVNDIFICELKNEEGNRSYTSLWLFSKEFCMECKDFMTRNDFDLTPLFGKITYSSIELKEYDLKTTNDKSFVKINP